jgi:hypothetical protein
MGFRGRNNKIGERGISIPLGGSEGSGKMEKGQKQGECKEKKLVSHKIIKKHSVEITEKKHGKKR